ncbi:unnamed protein product [Moneuplotes crassus]|uniref:Uncharacterized protein n=1 Tax=Euplotes crassus TaxID=5936 RepID=A0AAD1UQJ3_EUPCR|nr:unnamed protein product [Moneuplotes crassus]
MKRNKKLRTPSSRKQIFFMKRKKMFRIIRNQESFSKSRTIKRKNKSTQRAKKSLRVTSRVVAKSPPPTHNLRIFCIPDCETFKDPKERYIAVLKKVYNAVGRDLRGFHSSLALQKVLLTWESVKRQGNASF